MDDPDNPYTSCLVQEYISPDRPDPTRHDAYRDIPSCGQTMITADNDRKDRFCELLRQYSYKQLWLKRSADAGNEQPIWVFAYVTELSMRSVERLIGKIRCILWFHGSRAGVFTTGNHYFHSLPTNDSESRWQQLYILPAVMKEFVQLCPAWTPADPSSNDPNATADTAIPAMSWRLMWLQETLMFFISSELQHISTCFNRIENETFARSDQFWELGWNHFPLGSLVEENRLLDPRQAIMAPGIDTTFPPSCKAIKLEYMQLVVLPHPDLRSHENFADLFTTEHGGNRMDMLLSTRIDRLLESPLELDDGDIQIIHLPTLLQAVCDSQGIALSDDDDLCLCFYIDNTWFGESRYVPIDDSEHLWMVLEALRLRVKGPAGGRHRAMKPELYLFLASRNDTLDEDEDGIPLPYPLRTNEYKIEPARSFGENMKMARPRIAPRE
ncbi:ABC transporter [Venturia inaequalis]|nr:ABC transporter [Venturia inaequalis]